MRRARLVFEDFFVAPGDDVSRENILEAGELITQVIIPALSENARSYYIKQGARKSYDWSLADVAVVLEWDDDVCSGARVALGSAAPVPMRSGEAERALVGNRIDENIAIVAGRAAMNRARPLSQNAYKLPLFVSLIKQAVQIIA